MEVSVVAAPARTPQPADADAARVAAALQDPREFLALYDRYFERVLGYVRIRIGDAATCEDVTSDVFTTALAQLGRFRGDGTFAGWLFQITRNAVRDVQRLRMVEPLPEEVGAHGSELDNRLVEQERVDQLRRLVSSLEPDQQHLLALRYGAGLPFDEIGAVVGASAGAVRVRLHRLLHDLRERYPNDH